MIKTLKKISISQTDNTLIQFIRSLIVGSIAAVIDISLLYIFTNNLKIHYLISAAMSFTVGLTVNYFLSKKWIFYKVNFQNRFTEFSIFLIIGTVGLLLNELFIWYFTSQLNIYYMLSKIIATLIVFSWNFSSRKLILFR
jgi:putative flippase GtrA